MYQLWLWPLLFLLIGGRGVGQTVLYDEDDRAAAERIPELIEELEVSAGMHVADVGFGDGFFTVRLARAVGPQGRVWAVDIDHELAAQLRVRAQNEGLSNIEIILGSPDDPKLPPDQLDVVFSAYAYHEMTQHDAMLAKIWRALKPGGVFGLLEQSRSENRRLTREQQLSTHEIAANIVLAELRRTGFEIINHLDSFVLPPEGSTLVGYLIVARRPSPDR